MICPECGATLQRLAGADGYRVDRCLDIDRRSGRPIDVRSQDVVHACPRCEHVHSGNGTQSGIVGCMSRRESPSLHVRGIPRQLLDELEARATRERTTKSAIVVDVMRAYAAGQVTPAADPPPFDPSRKAAAPHASSTAPLAVNNIPADVLASFMARAKRDGWFSKNALIVELLRGATRL